MNIKSMVKRGLMDPAEAVGAIEHPLVEAAQAAVQKPAKKKSSDTKKRGIFSRKES